MRLSVVQMNPGADKAANIREAERLVVACVAADQPSVVVLPEVWTCLGGDRATKIASAERLPRPGSDDPPGQAYAFLSGLARRFAITVHGGSIGEAGGGEAGESEEAPIFNTTLVFGPDGAERGRYRKIHLFDITTPDGQGYRESATYGAGDRIVTCDLGGLTAGLAICYDLRFAELFLALRRAGAELIVLPAAFTVQTGRDHWETLLRARAIETQCWVAAAATIGRHTEIGRAGPAERHTYGHSLICDPWGHVVARASDGPGWASARIDRELTARVRRDMPVLEHRRIDQIRAAG
jgi:predicted amidohydrolase